MCTGSDDVVKSNASDKHGDRRPNDDLVVDRMRMAKYRRTESQHYDGQGAPGLGKPGSEWIKPSEAVSSGRQRVQLSEPDQARLAKKAKKSPSPFVDVDLPVFQQGLAINIAPPMAQDAPT